MEIFAIEISGEWYHVLYHPHITKFMIVKNSTGQHNMVEDNNGRWRSLNHNPFSEFLPIEELYANTREALKRLSPSSTTVPTFGNSNAKSDATNRTAQLRRALL